MGEMFLQNISNKTAQQLMCTCTIAVGRLSSGVVRLHNTGSEVFFLLFGEFFHRVVESIEEYIDVFFFLLARLFEERHRVFAAAFQRCLVEQYVHVVEQHAVDSWHVQLWQLPSLLPHFSPAA